MFGAAPLPSTRDEKLDFIFSRYDKDQDGTWKMGELFLFHQEILGDVLNEGQFAELCAKWGADSSGPKREHLVKRYEDNDKLLEQEFGLCLGLAACIA